MNILLTAEERDLVEAVAFVEETTASELLRPIVAEYLTKHLSDPDVAAALTALKNTRARKEDGICMRGQRAGTESSANL